MAFAVLVGIAIVHRLIWPKSKPSRKLSVWRIDSGDALTFGQALKVLIVLLLAAVIFFGIVAIEEHFLGIHD